MVFKGISLGARLAPSVGAGGKIVLKKIYSSMDALTDEDKIDIARQTYELANLYWPIARDRDAADRRAAEVEARKKASLETQVSAFRAEAKKKTSRESLRIEIADIKAVVRSGVATGTIEEDYLSVQKILALQDRLLALEGKENRMTTSSWWITLIGMISGLIGLTIGFLWGSS